MDVELYLKEMGQRIMERRKKLGLTQEALGERSGLTTQFVSYAESGKRAMRPENLMRMAAALGVSTDYLLTGDIIDKDKLLLSEKLDRLTAKQVRIVEAVIDECIELYQGDGQG
jgi:transcriptional regulator with XRE-family HTH domain